MGPNINEEHFIPPTPAPYTPKGGFNIKQLIYFLTVGIVTAALSGLVVWGYMSNQNDSNIKTLKSQITTKDGSIASLQKTVDDLNTKVGTTVSATTGAKLTNDQIFKEVSGQFGLSRSGFAYFRIYGQDRVSYEYSGGNLTGSGVTFAYKSGGAWHKTQESQDVLSCSAYSSVPESYKPVCDTVTNKLYTISETAYMNDQHESVNYPSSSMTSYIGQ